MVGKNMNVVGKLKKKLINRSKNGKKQKKEITVKDASFNAKIRHFESAI
jgi:hypothetical protein